MTTNIPTWLRITWTGISSSKDSLPRGETSTYGVARKEIKWGRRKPTVPDRFFYHLFLAGKSVPEMMKILHLQGDRNVWYRLNKLQEAGWITPRQRKRWRSGIYQRKRSPSSPEISQPKNLPLYQKVAALLQEDDYSIRELVELTSSPKGTITRYASRWKSLHSNHYRKLDRAEDD